MKERLQHNGDRQTVHICPAESPLMCNANKHSGLLKIIDMNGFVNKCTK